MKKSKTKLRSWGAASLDTQSLVAAPTPSSKSSTHQTKDVGVRRRLPQDRTELRKWGGTERVALRNLGLGFMRFTLDASDDVVHGFVDAFASILEELAKRVNEAPVDVRVSV